MNIQRKSSAAPQGWPKQVHVRVAYEDAPHKYMMVVYSDGLIQSIVSSPITHKEACELLASAEESK